MLSLVLGASLRAFWFARIRQFPSEEARRQAESRLWAQEGRRLRLAAVRQGGLLIKLGQFLSTRADVLPEEFTRELGQLQDVVPPVGWDAVEAILSREYGSRYVPDIFLEVEHEPLASASLAQVHRARRKDGQAVVVKVLRPNIGDAVRIDLDAVRIAARWAERFTSWGKRFDLEQIWRELNHTTEAELDTYGEAARAERFRQNFADDPMISAPQVHPGLTRPGLLVLDLVEGLKPGDVAAIDAAGIDRAQLSKRLVQSYMKQWLVDGFFHADPHPGNIFIQDGGRIVYVDFGMMGEMQPRDRESLRRFVQGIVKRDLSQCVDALVDLGFVRPGADLGKLRMAFGYLLDRLLGTTFTRASGAEVEQFVREIRDFLYEHPFQIPARYTFLGRALGILAGMAATLAPGENFVRLLIDGARKYVDTRSAQGVRDVLTGFARRVGEPVAQILRILARFDRDDYRLPVDVEPLRREIERSRVAIARLTEAVVGGFALVGAVLAGSHVPLLRDLLYVVAAIFAVRLLWRRAR